MIVVIEKEISNWYYFSLLLSFRNEPLHFILYFADLLIFLIYFLIMMLMIF